jgi:Flp pilus assembly protein TadD
MLCAVSLLLLPAPATAQKDAFIDAFIEFHSEIAGTYGDEGARAASALDRMATALDAWNAANRNVEASLRTAPGYAPSTLALFFLEAGRPADALKAIESAIQVEPPRAGVHMLHGVLLDAAGRHADAVRAFATAWQLDPADPLTAYLLADRAAAGQAAPDPERQIAALLAASRPVGTTRPRIPFLQAALIDDRAADSPRFAPAAYAAAFALFAEGRYEDAITRFRVILSQDPLVADPVGRSDQVVRGAAALRKGQAAGAVALFEAAVAQHPFSPEAHRILGGAHAAAGNVSASLERLSAAVRLANANERARVALARALMDAGRIDDAERVLLETIALLPASGRARWALADLYVSASRAPEAIAQLEEVGGLPVPAGRNALLSRIAGLANELHDYERVLSALARRARLIPDDAVAHRNLGIAFHRAGRDGQALIELLTASLLGHDDSEMLAVMGRIHLNAGRAEAAETVLRRAVLLDAKSGEARYALARTLLRLGRPVEAQQELAEFEKLRVTQLDEQRRKLELDLQQRTNDLSATPPKE